MDHARAAARGEYTRRMHRVLAHIDQRLDEPLALADLAAVAHFSPFHFHRLFTAWMGETLGEYLRRRRLEVAALHLLTQPRTPVLQIALRVGFGSSEAFAHAFKDHFACSASEWRRHKATEREAHKSKLDQARRKADQADGDEAGDDGGHHQPLEPVMLNVRVEEREAVQLLYLRHTGPYGAGIMNFWRQQLYPFLIQHSLMGRPIYGISHDDPNITAPEKCRYDAGVPIKAGDAVPLGAQVTTIPGGRYATLPFKGGTVAIAEAWAALMRDWLPQSGWMLDGRPTFEYYPTDATFDEATGEFSCDIVIPLAPLNA